MSTSNIGQRLYDLFKSPIPWNNLSEEDKEKYVSAAHTFQNVVLDSGPIIHLPAFEREYGIITRAIENQNQLNCKLSPFWITNGKRGDWSFATASFIEAAELVQSIWSPWWSKKSYDTINAHIELVDIMHFELSRTLVECDGNVEAAADRILEQYKTHLDSKEIDAQNPNEKKETDEEIFFGLVASIIDKSPYVWLSIFKVADRLQLSFDQIFTGYFAKSLLNEFRWSHGYKEGTYKKIWTLPSGKVQEDNKALFEWILEAENPGEEEIRSFLESMYKICNQKYQVQQV
jgi:hypothetical protein